MALIYKKPVTVEIFINSKLINVKISARKVTVVGVLIGHFSPSPFVSSFIFHPPSITNRTKRGDVYTRNVQIKRGNFSCAMRGQLVNPKNLCTDGNSNFIPRPRLHDQAKRRAAIGHDSTWSRGDFGGDGGAFFHVNNSIWYIESTICREKYAVDNSTIT